MRRSIPIAFIVLAACSQDPVDEGTGVREPVAAVEPSQSVPAATTEAVTLGSVVAEQPKLAVESEGLRWFLPPNGSARPLSFGEPEVGVLASLERVRGPAVKGVNQDCGAGPVQYANWADGLSLVFQNGEFAGWGLDQRAAGAIATANGVGPGTTRTELAASFGSVTFQNTSLGLEFAAGDIFGLLEGTGPEAKITHMWAGVSCVAR